LAVSIAAISRQTEKVDGVLALWEVLQSLQLIEGHSFFSWKIAVLWPLWLLTPRSYWKELAHSLKSLPVPLGELIGPKILSPEHGCPNQTVPLLWQQLMEQGCWGSCRWQWYCLENLYSYTAPSQAEMRASLTADEKDTGTASQGTVCPGKWKVGDEVWHHPKKCHERGKLLCSRDCFL